MPEQKIGDFLNPSSAQINPNETVWKELKIAIINPDQAKATLTGSIQAIIQQFGFPEYDFGSIEEEAFAEMGKDYTNQGPNITDPMIFIQDLSNQIKALMPERLTNEQDFKLPEWSIKYLTGFDKSEYELAANQEKLAIKTTLIEGELVRKTTNEFIKKHSKTPIRLEPSTQNTPKTPHSTSYILGATHQHAATMEFIEKHIKRNPDITRGELAKLLLEERAVNCDSWSQ